MVIKKPKIISFIFALFTLNCACLAQNAKIDSLTKLLQNTKQDTTRLRLYIALGDACDVKDNLKYAEPALKLVDKLLLQTTDEKERKNLLKQKAYVYNFYLAFYVGGSDTSKIFEYPHKMLAIYQEIKDTSNIVEIVLDFASYYNRLGDFSKELEYLQKGLSISKEMSYKKGIASCLSGMGDFFRGQDNQLAMDYYQKSLSIYYELKDTNQAADVLRRTGDFYGEQNNIEKALECYQKAMALYEAKRSKDDIIWMYNLFGLTYMDGRDFKKALENYQKGLLMAEEIKNNHWISVLLNNIGYVYYNSGDYDTALDYQLRGLRAADNGGLSISSLAKTYLKLKKYKQAKYYSNLFLESQKKSGFLGNIRNAELLASQIDSASGNGYGAYEHYKQYILVQEKLKSEEVRKMGMKEKFQNEYDKQKAIDKAEQEKKDLQAAEEKRQQHIITWSVAGGLLLVVIFSGFILRSLRITRKQKVIIEIQKTEVEKSKQIVENKNKDILDSIHYAKRIQQSLLPTQKYIDKTLKRLQSK